jgi:hypothetical protein
MDKSKNQALSEALASCIFCQIGRGEKKAEFVAKFDHCY